MLRLSQKNRDLFIKSKKFIFDKIKLEKEKQRTLQEEQKFADKVALIALIVFGGIVWAVAFWKLF